MTTKLKYFVDSEFIEDGRTIDLISIGIVCEDGRELYLINSQCDFSKASDWVKENVIAQLQPPTLDVNDPVWTHRLNIQRLVADFMGAILPNDLTWRYVLAEGLPKPEIWAHYGSYDWVVFCQLFGTMMDLPVGFPMHIMDLKQWCQQLGNPQLPLQGKDSHNALADARHNQVMYQFLSEYDRSRS